MKPSTSPEEALQRVLRLAKMNGTSILVVAFLGALLSLAFGDLVGTAVGLIVAYGGWTELVGRRALAAGDLAGLERMRRAQWIVLGPILVYCVTRLVSFDEDTMLGTMSSGMRTELMSAGVDLNAILPLVRLVFYTTYTVFALVSVIYQGGMARYYRKRTDIVRQALANRLKPAVPPVLPTGPAPEDLVT